MYKPIDRLQHSFLDFNQPMGLHMNPDNRWIKMADRIPWDEFEIKYAELFPSDTGNVAKPLRMALGALIIQTKFQYPDRELVEQIAENPYLQYFIGLPGYQEEAPFDASTLVLFRKRISAEMLMEANECLLSHKDDGNSAPPSSGCSNDDDASEEAANKGTLTLDASCAPANIRYPQDISLLNEAREKLEAIIYRFCKSYGLPLPRRYRKRARKDYLAFVDKKQEYQDNTDRIEVERAFSLSKRCYGMGCITTKLEETQLTSIALSVFVTNLFKIQKRILFTLLSLFRFWDGLTRGRNLELQMVA